MTRLLDHITLRGKFTVIGLLAVAMLALPSSFLFSAEWTHQSDAQREAAAIAPARALLQLLRLTQQHRGLAAQALGGNEQAGAARAERQAEIDKAMTQALAAIATLGDAKLADAGK